MILEDIQNNFHSFSEKEKKIATYIMKKKHLKNINITDLAILLGVSTSTITRFCKKMGCNNFAEMKIRLIDENSMKPILEKKNNIFEDVHLFYATVMDNTVNLVDNDEIKKTLDLLKSGNRIYLYGIGSSGLTAIEFTQRMLRMGLNVACYTDSHMMLISQTLIQPGDIVIGISSSGQTHEIVNVLAHAKKVKATTISITSFPNSNVTDYSDISLLVYSSKFVNNRNFINNQFSVMFLIDILTMLLLDYEEYDNAMQKTINTILERGSEE